MDIPGSAGSAGAQPRDTRAGAQPPDTSFELEEKYRALVPELQRRRADVRVSRRHMVWLLVAAAVTTPVGWHFGIVAFLGLLTLWLTLFATGIYIATMYEWGYERQIAAAESEIERLRSERAQDGERSAEERAQALVPPHDPWSARRVPRQASWGIGSSRAR